MILVFCIFALLPVSQLSSELSEGNLGFLGALLCSAEIFLFPSNENLSAIGSFPLYICHSAVYIY